MNKGFGEFRARLRLNAGIFHPEFAEARDCRAGAFHCVRVAGVVSIGGQSTPDSADPSGEAAPRGADRHDGDLHGRDGSTGDSGAVFAGESREIVFCVLRYERRRRLLASNNGRPDVTFWITLPSFDVGLRDHHVFGDLATALCADATIR